MKQFITAVQIQSDRRGHTNHVRITIPLELSKVFRLDKDDILILEPDLAMGFIKLIPAKVVPRNELTRLEKISQ